MSCVQSSNLVPEPEAKDRPEISPVEALERQAVESALHAHTVDSRLATRIHALESTLYGLVDLLTSKRMVGESEVAASAHRIAQTIEERGEQAHGGVVMRVDPPGQATVTVNCTERMPICKAICCRLSFPLTAQEIQDGQLKWDLGKPYFIRHDERGACVHQNTSTGGCTVYNKRPDLCKRYSCQADKRIWKDFANMVLNQEWIDAHLGCERPQLIQIRMDRLE